MKRFDGADQQTGNYRRSAHIFLAQQMVVDDAYVAMLFGLGGLIVFAKSSAIAPFIYTLF